MELALIKMLAFLRPLMDMNLSFGVASVSLVDLGGIILSASLVASLFIAVATRKDAAFTLIDLLILVFIGWCVAVYLIYIDKSDLRELIRWTVPLLTYTVAKTVIQNEVQYRRIIGLMIVGLCIPAVLSAALILQGKGIFLIQYWTGIPRYEGVYIGPHNMSHDMAFLIMLMGVYFAMSPEMVKGSEIRENAKKLALVFFGAIALYCIYMSSVRTTVLGLVMFGAILIGGHYRKKAVLLVSAAAVLLALATSESVQNRFLRETAQAEKDPTFDASYYGGGRPIIWGDYLRTFFSMPLDRQLGGVGLGNNSRQKWGDWPISLDAHNDYLNVLVFTGYIGFGLFMALQIAILRRILGLDGRRKYIFLALFFAVSAMNLISNSYVTRFGLGQMYYLVLAYIEISRSRASSA